MLTIVWLDIGEHLPDPTIEGEWGGARAQSPKSASQPPLSLQVRATGSAAFEMSQDQLRGCRWVGW